MHLVDTVRFEKARDGILHKNSPLLFKYHLLLVSMAAVVRRSRVHVVCAFVCIVIVLSPLNFRTAGVLRVTDCTGPWFMFLQEHQLYRDLSRFFHLFPRSKCVGSTPVRSLPLPYTSLLVNYHYEACHLT